MTSNCLLSCCIQMSERTVVAWGTLDGVNVYLYYYQQSNPNQAFGKFRLTRDFFHTII